LRLREQREEGAAPQFELTQKLSAESSGEPQGLITTVYLVREEFEVIAGLPARILSKIRQSVPPFGMDVFQGELTGLVLAQAEFNSVAEASALALSSFIACELTDDSRFTAGVSSRPRDRNSRIGLRNMG